MQQDPKIVTRDEQAYVAVKRSVTMQTFGEIADRLGQVFEWLGERGIEPAGAPFFRYDVIDMMRELVVEAGVPVDKAVDGDGEVFAGMLPAGRYVEATHEGHPDSTVEAIDELLQWADRQDLTWDMRETPDGEVWGCRLEIQNTDPSAEPDMNKWETVLAFRLAD